MKTAFDKACAAYAARKQAEHRAQQVRLQRELFASLVPTPLKEALKTIGWAASVVGRPVQVLNKKALTS
jgi:hypothetical protein